MEQRGTRIAVPQAFTSRPRNEDSDEEDDDDGEDGAANPSAAAAAPPPKPSIEVVDEEMHDNSGKLVAEEDEGTSDDGDSDDDGDGFGGRGKGKGKKLGSKLGDQAAAAGGGKLTPAQRKELRAAEKAAADAAANRSDESDTGPDSDDEVPSVSWPPRFSSANPPISLPFLSRKDEAAAGGGGLERDTDSEDADDDDVVASRRRRRRGAGAAAGARKTRSAAAAASAAAAVVDDEELGEDAALQCSDAFLRMQLGRLAACPPVHSRSSSAAVAASSSSAAAEAAGVPVAAPLPLREGVLYTMVFPPMLPHNSRLRKAKEDAAAAAAASAAASGAAPPRPFPPSAADDDVAMRIQERMAELPEGQIGHVSRSMIVACERVAIRLCACVR